MVLCGHGCIDRRRKPAHQSEGDQTSERKQDAWDRFSRVEVAKTWPNQRQAGSNPRVLRGNLSIEGFRHGSSVSARTTQHANRPRVRDARARQKSHKKIRISMSASGTTMTRRRSDLCPCRPNTECIVIEVDRIGNHKAKKLPEGSFFGARGGTRTPTDCSTSTSNWRVYHSATRAILTNVIVSPHGVHPPTAEPCPLPVPFLRGRRCPASPRRACLRRSARLA